jgi:hypothetical protein
MVVVCQPRFECLAKVIPLGERHLRKLSCLNSSSTITPNEIIRARQQARRADERQCRHQRPRRASSTRRWRVELLLSRRCMTVDPPVAHHGAHHAWAVSVASPRASCVTRIARSCRYQLPTPAQLRRCRPRADGGYSSREQSPSLRRLHACFCRRALRTARRLQRRVAAGKQVWEAVWDHGTTTPRNDEARTRRAFQTTEMSSLS